MTPAGVIYESPNPAPAPAQPVFAETFAGMQPAVTPRGSGPYAIPIQGARIPLFAGVDYPGVWPGIDLTLSAGVTGVQHRYTVQAGAQPGKIALALQGVAGMRLAGDGALLIDTPSGTLTQGAPRIYQIVSNHPITVSGEYKLLGPSVYGFEIGSYATQYPLYIETAPIELPHAATTPAVAPLVTYFNVAPTSTLPGQAAIGTLLVTGATSATVNGVNANCTAGSCGGTFLFAPTSSTNYVMQATGPGGTITASQQVEVGKYQPNPPPIPAGMKVTWQGACWLKNYPKALCNGACQGMSFNVSIPTPPAELPLEATLYLGTTTCNPSQQDNLNDTGALTGSGGWIFWFIHHPNLKNSSAIWTIGNQSSGCVSYAKAPICP